MYNNIIELVKEFCIDNEYYRIVSPTGKTLGRIIVYNDGTFSYGFPRVMDEDGWEPTCFTNAAATRKFFTDRVVKEINSTKIIVNYEPDYENFKFSAPWATWAIEIIFTEDYFD